ncbi:MAG: bifunctional hydroxymethylpyrimidine kinase/phosphomethylpyrimidine kinase [Chthoniobacteraceae bacterium]
MQSSPPVALTIAGSDNSAGAGAQADLKTFGALGVYGITAITCVVAEVPGRVSAIQPVDAHIVREQIMLSYAAYPVAALKTGLLHSRKIIEIVCDTIEELFAGDATRPLLVVDPVMVATSGDALLNEDAVAVYTGRLFKLATLVTPNLDEVRALLGRSVTTVYEMRTAGQELAEKFGTSFLLKGGHLRGSEAATDLLFSGAEIREFSAPFVPGVATHGTGCTYSAAITAGLAKGLRLPDAIGEAKPFVTRAIANHFTWQRGGGATAALNHFL